MSTLILGGFYPENSNFDVNFVYIIYIDRFLSVLNMPLPPLSLEIILVTFPDHNMPTIFYYIYIEH